MYLFLLRHCKSASLQVCFRNRHRSGGVFKIFGKRHNNQMIKFLLIVYFHGTKSYQSIFLFLNSISNIQYIIPYIYILYIYIIYIIYIVCVPQYVTRTRRGIETTCESLETRSDRLILSNNICDFTSIILKNIILRMGS